MNKNDISIATITLARNDGEEKLLRESLQQLAELRIPVFITDGGSREGFLDFLRSIPHFTLSKANARGVWNQAKNSLSEAYQANSEFIFYTEPDKLEFFRKGLPDMLGKVQTNEKTGIIMASRSDIGFSTFPRFQQMTETAINKCCAEIMGKPVDYTYGPFLLKEQLVPYLKLVQEDIGWGWRPFTFGIAHRLGLEVDAFIKDFSCPSDQREDNATERIYRMKQLNQNIQGLVLSTTIAI